LRQPPADRAEEHDRHGEQGDAEVGDQVDIRGYNDGNRFVADTINVTRSVRQ